MNEYPQNSKVYENKRVVLVTGNSSKWYEQAIFIIKKDTPPKKLPKDFILEAESIIENYMNNSTKNVNTAVMVKTEAKKRRNSRKLDSFINLAMLVSCVAIFCILSYRFL